MTNCSLLNCSHTFRAFADVMMFVLMVFRRRRIWLGCWWDFDVDFDVLIVDDFRFGRGIGSAWLDDGGFGFAQSD